MVIGVISDTHGRLREEAIDALRGAEAILHAGDIGDPSILESLAGIAPVTAVRGNNDRGGWAQTIAEVQRLEFESVPVMMIHDRKQLKELPESGVLIAGHSHRPQIEQIGGLLFVNPGSAGPAASSCRSRWHDCTSSTTARGPRSSSCEERFDQRANAGCRVSLEIRCWVPGSLSHEAGTRIPHRAGVRFPFSSRRSSAYNRVNQTRGRAVSKKWYNYFVVTPPSEGPPATAPEVQNPPPIRASDLVPDAESDTTFDAPVSTPADLSEIYDSARIPTPSHGYTVLKVAEMLRSEHIRDLPPEVKKKSLMVALDAAGVKIAEIVEDAVQRDRALDTYERVLQKALEELNARKELENQQIEEEINQRVAELRARIAQNDAETSREQRDLIAWRASKRQEEERIAEAIGYFVSPNPITTTGTATRNQGESDVR